jgi:hypothetical protein
MASPDLELLRLEEVPRLARDRLASCQPRAKSIPRAEKRP